MTRATAALALLGACTLLLHGSTRGDLGGQPGWAHAAPVALAWLVATIAWWVLSRGASPHRADPSLASLALALRLLALAALPAFTDDVYRYLWDGRLLIEGLDPFAGTPRQAWESADPALRARLADLWPQLNSPDYATVYPPVLQALFALSAWLGSSLRSELMVLGGVLLAADLVTIATLDRLLARLGGDRRGTWVYALSPLVVVELVGQRHPEGLALCGLLLTLLFATLARPKAAGLALGAAIGAKLLPAIALPFMLRRPGGRPIVAVATVTAALLLAPIALSGDIASFWSSLRLYYELFAFNDALHGAVREVVGSRAGPVLAGLTGLGLLLAAAAERAPTWRSAPTALTFAFGAYQLTATTIHPWYLVPVLGLGVVSGLRFPVVWAALVPATYIAYWGPHGIEEVAGVVWAETGLVLLAMMVDVAWLLPTLDEIVARRPILRRLFVATLPPRIAIKRELLLPLIQPQGPVLDLGSGTGTVCAMLRAEGHDVTPVDVVDVHLAPGTAPRRYDGASLPDADDTYDTVLLITVLHHCPDPDAVLAEAARVARRQVVVMEDVHGSLPQRWLTRAADSLVNLEFRDHPHTNRTDAQWRHAFSGLGLQVVEARHRRTLWLFHQVVYVLSVRESSGRSDLAG